jgi:hypothetical protein
MEVSDDDDDDHNQTPTAASAVANDNARLCHLEIGQGSMIQRLRHLEMAFGQAHCSGGIFMSRLTYLEEQLGVTPTGVRVGDRLAVLEEFFYVPSQVQIE